MLITDPPATAGGTDLGPRRFHDFEANTIDDTEADQKTRCEANHAMPCCKNTSTNVLLEPTESYFLKRIERLSPIRRSTCNTLA